MDEENERVTNENSYVDESNKPEQSEQTEPVSSGFSTGPVVEDEGYTQDWKDNQSEISEEDLSKLHQRVLDYGFSSDAESMEERKNEQDTSGFFSNNRENLATKYGTLGSSGFSTGPVADNDWMKEYENKPVSSTSMENLKPLGEGGLSTLDVSQASETVLGSEVKSEENQEINVNEENEDAQNEKQEEAQIQEEIEGQEEPKIQDEIEVQDEAEIQEEQQEIEEPEMQEEQYIEVPENNIENIDVNENAIQEPEFSQSESLENIENSENVGKISLNENMVSEENAVETPNVEDDFFAQDSSEQDVYSQPEETNINNTEEAKEEIANNIIQESPYVDNEQNPIYIPMEHQIFNTENNFGADVSTESEEQNNIQEESYNDYNTESNIDTTSENVEDENTVVNDNTEYNNIASEPAKIEENNITNETSFNMGNIEQPVEQHVEEPEPEQPQVVEENNEVVQNVQPQVNSERKISYKMCRKCGNMNPTGTRICSRCGNVL